MTLARSFYQRSTPEVARDLIGKIFVRKLNDCRKSRLSGVIVETEAYGCEDDPASHAWRGMTERNRVMFGDAGVAYVYFTYGSHHCVNVSAKIGAPAGAVLIRSIEPLDGIKVMQRLRGLDNPFALTSGPGKLAQAMKITLEQNGLDLTDHSSEINIEDSHERQQVLATARIGISKAKDKQWRFVDPSSPFLSRKTRLASLQVK